MKIKHSIKGVFRYRTETSYFHYSIFSVLKRASSHAAGMIVFSAPPDHRDSILFFAAGDSEAAKKIL